MAKLWGTLEYREMKNSSWNWNIEVSEAKSKLGEDRESG